MDGLDNQISETGNNIGEQQVNNKKERKLFKHPFSFKGRINRLEYWLTWNIYTWIILLLFIVGGITAILFIDSTKNSELGIAIYCIIFFVPLPFLLWFIFAQTAKRCHDINISGWWQLFKILRTLLLFIPGQNKPNKYGETPPKNSLTTKILTSIFTIISIVALCFTIFFMSRVGSHLYGEDEMNEDVRAEKKFEKMSQEEKNKCVYPKFLDKLVGVSCPSFDVTNLKFHSNVSNADYIEEFELTLRDDFSEQAIQAMIDSVQNNEYWKILDNTFHYQKFDDNNKEFIDISIFPEERLVIKSYGKIED